MTSSSLVFNLWAVNPLKEILNQYIYFHLNIIIKINTKYTNGIRDRKAFGLKDNFDKVHSTL